MKKLISLEESVFFLFTFYLFLQLGYPWWLFFVLLFTPDLSMLGYYVDDKVGAIIYNFIHHRGLSILLYVAGIYFEINLLSLVGLVLLSHSTLDRAFGYGLKRFKGFKFTHLGDL